MDAYTVHTINQALVLSALIVTALIAAATPIYLAIADHRDNKQRIADAIEREKRLDARRAARQR